MEEEEREDEGSDCPYLTPKVSGRIAVFSIPVYCCMPNGRVRVPPRGQLVFLCTAGHHHDCPGYRRWRPRGASDSH